MAIVLNDKLYNNLQEQVSYLTSKLEDLKELNIVGIKIVGEVSAEGLLPNPLTYEGNYGDAYIVRGVEDADNNLFVFTRGNNNIATPHWFNLGQFPLPGPTGATGPAGSPGERGIASTWNYGAVNPTLTTGYNKGDMYVNTANYDIFNLVGTDTLYWQRIGNIKGVAGPAGPAGIQGIPGSPGEKGDTGERGPAGTIQVVATVASVDDLPLPTYLDDMSKAYLVGTTSPYELFIQVGESPSVAVWRKIGLSSDATLVTVDGVGVEDWNADTKVDKLTSTSFFNRLYAHLVDGTEVGVKYTTTAEGGAVAQRDVGGRIKAAAPVEDADVVNKIYVDGNFIKENDADAKYMPLNSSSSVNVSTSDSLGFNVGGDAQISSQGNTNIEAVGALTLVGESISVETTDGTTYDLMSKLGEIGSGGGSGTVTYGITKEDIAGMTSDELASALPVFEILKASSPNTLKHTLSFVDGSSIECTNIIDAAKGTPFYIKHIVGIATVEGVKLLAVEGGYASKTGILQALRTANNDYTIYNAKCENKITDITIYNDTVISSDAYQIALSSGFGNIVFTGNIQYPTPSKPTTPLVNFFTSTGMFLKVVNPVANVRYDNQLVMPVTEGTHILNVVTDSEGNPTYSWVDLSIPKDEGTYKLSVTVNSEGKVTYSWVLE